MRLGPRAKKKSGERRLLQIEQKKKAGETRLLPIEQKRMAGETRLLPFEQKRMAGEQCGHGRETSFFNFGVQKLSFQARRCRPRAQTYKIYGIMLLKPAKSKNLSRSKKSREENAQ